MTSSFEKLATELMVQVRKDDQVALRVLSYE